MATVKVALVAPLGIVTLVGTLPAGRLEEATRFTVTPAAGAGALIVTVPVTMVEDPPTTESGETLSDVTSYGLTTKDASCRLPLEVKAPIVTVWECETTDVVTVKVALVAPLGIVTLIGTLPAGRLEEATKLTNAPAAGAGALIVTVPLTTVGEPPTTEPGETPSEVTSYGLTTRDAV